MTSASASFSTCGAFCASWAGSTGFHSLMPAKTGVAAMNDMTRTKTEPIKRLLGFMVSTFLYVTSDLATISRLCLLRDTDRGAAFFVLASLSEICGAPWHGKCRKASNYLIRFSKIGGKQSENRLCCKKYAGTHKY